MRTLLDAAGLVEQRDTYHADYVQAAARLGVVWTAILDDVPYGKPVPPERVLLMLAALKMNRALDSPQNPDHWRDGAAYFAMAGVAVAYGEIDFAAAEVAVAEAVGAPLSGYEDETACPKHPDVPMKQTPHGLVCSQCRSTS